MSGLKTRQELEEEIQGLRVENMILKSDLNIFRSLTCTLNHPCSRCGTLPLISQIPFGEDIEVYSITCPKCGKYSGDRHTLAEVVEDWKKQNPIRTELKF